MSKRVELKCTIKNANAEMMRKALNNMLKFFDGSMRNISENKVSLKCDKLGMFGTYISVENGKLVVEGYDDYNETGKVKQAVENFYTATMFEEEFNSPMEMDEEGDIVLMVEA